MPTVSARQLVLAALLACATPVAARSPEPGRASGKRAPLVLAAPRSFASAVAMLEKATGVAGEQVRDDIPLDEGRRFAVDSKTAARVLAAGHASFKSAGLFLFRFERGFGLGDKDQLVVLATADAKAVVRRIGTAGPNQRPTTEEIIAWLDVLAHDEPFELWEIGTDYISGKFRHVPRNPRAIARRCAAFAPELVAGGANGLELLAAMMKANPTLYLIW